VVRYHSNSKFNDQQCKQKFLTEKTQKSNKNFRHSCAKKFFQRNIVYLTEFDLMWRKQNLDMSRWARYVSLCIVYFFCQTSSHRFLVFFPSYLGYCSHWNYEINSGGHHACLREKEHLFNKLTSVFYAHALTTRKSCAIKMCDAVQGNGLNPTRDVCFLSKGRRATKKLKTNTTCYLSFRGAPAAASTTLFTHSYSGPIWCRSENFYSQGSLG